MRTFVLLFPIVFLAALPSYAEMQDPHAIYETKCGGCHDPHAGQFARARLVLLEGTVRIRGQQVLLLRFLESVHGKLADQEIDLLLRHFSAILLSGGLYDEKCRSCNERAVLLARGYLGSVDKLDSQIT